MSEGLSNSYLSGEVIIAVVFGGIVLLSAMLTPSTDVLTLFGYEIPVVCGFRRLTGYGCPGCGLTRSFAFMAHGDVFGAFGMNYFGPLLFSAFAVQPPYRVYTIGRELLRRHSSNGSLVEGS